MKDVLTIGTLFAVVSYRAVPSGTRETNNFAFCVFWFLPLVFGACTTPQSKQTAATTVGILVIPFALDFLMAYHGAYVPFVLALCLLCISSYGVAVICACYRDMRKGRYRKKWMRFFQSLLFRIREIISVVLVMALLIFGAGSLVADYFIPESPVDTLSYEKVRPILDTMGNRTDTIAKLDDKCWRAMSSSVRLSTLQEILDIECTYLGIPYPLTVSVAEMEHESILGYYSHGEGIVCINQSVFERATGKFLLSILLHEVYHSYERGILELYEHTDVYFRNLKLFEKAPIYDYEFKNYISGQENLEAYTEQAVEKDSRTYSSLRIQEYQTVLEYLHLYPP